MMALSKSNHRKSFAVVLGLLVVAAAHVGSLTGCSKGSSDADYAAESPVEMSPPESLDMETAPAMVPADPPVTPIFPEAVAHAPSAAQGYSLPRSSNRTTATQAARSSDSLMFDDPASFESSPPPLAAAMAAAPPTNTSPNTSPNAANVAPVHASHLPAGSNREAADGFATVRVFYATDRGRDSVALNEMAITGQKEVFAAMAGGSVLLIAFGGFGWLIGRTRLRTASLLLGCISGVAAAAFTLAGQANIEKHGVQYTSDRGSLVRGICDVTVPDSHQRGLVERPSLLRLEFREDQKQHIVLTSATELTANDFHNRLAKTVSDSDKQDLLVFIHGYNVDFESAVQRTAQIAVDLPFTGTPICYSWPSQATLLGYSIDENNAVWTVTHLKKFLLELAKQSGARSINVVAHSMGNRAMTAAIRQIDFQLGQGEPKVFDRIVLAAPDVDADHFRRDLAPSLLNVASQVTLYASSDDQALIASKQVHGYPRAGESGPHLVVVPGIETIDVSGIDLSLLGHSYYGDNESMLRDLYEVVGARLPATNRGQLIPRGVEPMTYWQLAQRPTASPATPNPIFDR